MTKTTGERTPAQVGYDERGYYDRQTVEPRHESTYLAWAADMTNRRAHCRDGRDPKTGEPRRWLDQMAPEYIAYHDAHSWDDGFEPYGDWALCTVDHSDDPKRVGEIEWMRFIHTYGQLAPEGVRYFTDDGVIWIDPVGQVTSEGRRCYAEVYFNRPARRDDPSGRFAPKFALFLANAQDYARMECYDPALTALCQQVWDAVQASYGLTVTA